MLHRDQPVSSRRLPVLLLSRCRCGWCGVSQRSDDVARNLPSVMRMIRGKGADSGTAAQKPQQAQLQYPESGSAYRGLSGCVAEPDCGYAAGFWLGGIQNLGHRHSLI